MPKFTPLQSAFTDTLMDLYALRRIDVDLPGLRHHTNEFDFAVGRLCDALAHPNQEDVKELAYRAHRAVLRLAQMLDPVDSDDRRTRDKLDLARAAVAALPRYSTSWPHWSVAPIERFATSCVSELRRS